MALVSEKFNGAGSDVVWTQVTGNGTFDPDYTDVILEGAQSCALTFNSVNERWYTSWSGTDALVYVASMFQLPSGNTTRYLAYFNTGLGYLRLIWATDHWHVRLGYNATTATITGSYTISPGTTYYIKIAYNNGSGEDGIWTVWLSTDGIDWTQDISITNATDTAQMTTFNLMCTAGTNVYDDIRVDTTDINYGAGGAATQSAAIKGFLSRRLVMPYDMNIKRRRKRGDN